MDVLCADKTGTLTRNELEVTMVQPMFGYDEAQVLTLAALASSDGEQDPVDAAIRAAAAIARPTTEPPRLVNFTPFDPATKMSRATFTDAENEPQGVVKGAFAIIAGLAQPSTDAGAAADKLERKVSEFWRSQPDHKRR